MASNRLNIHEAIGLAAIIRLAGPNLSESDFAQAAGQKGFYDAASAISADMRDFRLLVVSNSIRNLSEDCVSQLDQPSAERLRRLAAAPSRFRAYWRALISGESPKIAKPYDGSLRVSSTVCGFLNASGWNLPAIQSAIDQDFTFGDSTSTVKPQAEPASRRAKSSALGLELRCYGVAGCEFPQLLTNLFAQGCPPSPSIESVGDWELTINAPITPENREWARQWIFEAANSLRSGRGS